MAENILKSAMNNRSVSQILKSYYRVLKLARKPARDEFLMISKVAGAGIIVIGIVGFVVYILLTELPTWV
ncbi:protein translocase SEC61 complex subunit gamma [Methanohalophilus mahii]|nr:protein translocase SEC61 complex subunit gamma [Methanohalophilus mahii]